MTKGDLSQDCKAGSIFKNQSIDQCKEGKKHMTIAIDSQKVFDKIDYLFVIKTLSKLGTEGNVINLRKDIYKNLHLTSYLTVKVSAFPVR